MSSTIKNRIVEFREIPGQELLENDGNWRMHPEAQRRALRSAVEEIGLAGALLAYHSERNDMALTVIDGHLRRREYAEVVWPTLILDVDDAEADLLLQTYDPLTAMAETNSERLAALRARLRPQSEALRQTVQEAVALAKERLPQPETHSTGKNTSPEVDWATELQKKWGVEAGQLWALGQHRVICGDCTDKAVVERLIEGERMAIVSDPPYGINVDTSWLSALNVQRGKPANLSDDKLAGDDGKLDLSFVFEYKEWLVFGFPHVARDKPYTGLLVWDKRGDGGEGGLGNPVEVAATNTFNGYRLKRHVWAGYVRAAGEKREPHPTQKPVGIMEDAIILVKRDAIFDPFLGSGTTLIACDNLGHRCRGVEIEPKYVAVILQRYFAHTGQAPERIE